MSRFGGADDGPDGAAALQDEIQRIAALPLAQLAVEVMVKAFGPDGPGGPGQPGTLEDLDSATVQRLGLNEITRACSPAWAGHGVDPARQREFSYLIAEGLQLVENASLVRVGWQGGQAHYMATRRGRTALAQNEIESALAGRV
jgi:hypothetical protein